MLHRHSLTRTLSLTWNLLTVMGFMLLGQLLHPPMSAQAQPSSSSVIIDLEGGGSNTAPNGRHKESDIHPEDVIHWTLAGQSPNYQNNTLAVTLALTTERQFTIFQDKLKFEPSEGWTIKSIKTPPTSRQFDEISQKDVDVYAGGPFDLELTAAKPPTEAFLTITYVGCTKVICLFPHSQKIVVPWTAANESKASIGPSESVDSSPVTPTGTFEEAFAKKVKDGALTFSTLLLIAFIGGLLTNLTPCVAPMIPITIRLLANQTIKPLLSSSMYALGIMATYTVLGVVAALSGALFGNLIAHPAVSITFGVIMFVLGLNMLGFGDLSKLQQIGGQIGSSRGGTFNAFLMGAGAGLVASPCTGPILAALLTYTAGRQNTMEAIGLLGTYSFGFALPYVFLGASAAKLSKIRVNFQVQILTKLLFASIMFALSLYFMRIPLYGAFTAIRAYWPMIGIVGVVGGLIASAIIIANEAFHHRKSLFLIPTVILGIGTFFGIQSLTRETSPSTHGIRWLHTEQEASDEAQKSGKPIIADAWAEWCEACKKMDVTTFEDKDIINEINEHWVALKFDLTEINDENTKIQDRYELPGLPTLTLMPPDGDLKRKQAINGYASAPALHDALQKNQKKLSTPTVNQ